jgi:hypothetical protein
MSYPAKRELLRQIAPRYQSASHAQRSVILDEFAAATGYARKYAIRLLTGPIRLPGEIRRPRVPRYGPAVGAALEVAWRAANGICAKRLVPFLPELVPALEHHGHLTLTAAVRDQLLSLSPATADRLLQPVRRGDQPRGLSTTRRGPLLKQQIPIRTFSGWDDARPGFMEADLVAHCGGQASGPFLHTLTVTDVATGWTECAPIRQRTPAAVLAALGRIRALLPLPLLGLDTDNGLEFINNELVDYCEREAITFTRGRVANKNDQCYVEQKNGNVVRQLVGYDRFEGERAARQMTELYRAVRLYVNVFQPSMKVRLKERDGSRVRKRYDAARTPCRRLLASGVLPAIVQVRLQTIAATLDPVALLQQIGRLQTALWQHAVFPEPVASMTAGSGAMPDGAAAVRFAAVACGLVAPTAAEATASAAGTLTGAPEPAPRKYQRTKKLKGPRLYRTRPDPFAGVEAEIEAWLAQYPDSTMKALFRELQRRHPGQFPDVQLRTLQRKLAKRRARAVLTFDDGWLAEERLGEQALPRPLRAVVVADEPGEVDHARRPAPAGPAATAGAGAGPRRGPLGGETTA